MFPDDGRTSQLIARNTSTERLVVSSQGKALLTFHSRGRLQRVLAWGALNARIPTAVRLALGCPAVAQALGQLRHSTVKPGHGSWELRLSHWRGPLAKLDVWLDWSYSGRWHHLFGRLTYRGRPVHGYSTTPSGDPLDPYGRVL